MKDMTGREIKIGDKVAYIYTPYNKDRVECGGIGKIVNIDENKCRPVQVDFGETKQSYNAHKLVKIG